MIYQKWILPDSKIHRTGCQWLRIDFLRLSRGMTKEQQNPISNIYFQSVFALKEMTEYFNDSRKAVKMILRPS